MATSYTKRMAEIARLSIEDWKAKSYEYDPEAESDRRIVLKRDSRDRDPEAS